MTQKVSICIPACKEPAYLRATLQSVFSQTYTNFEVIITDDSPDNSVEQVVAEYAHSDKIKYKRNYLPKGSPGNWNESMRLATGAYIKLLHHDDCFVDESSLGRFVAMLESHPESDFAFSASVVCNEDLSTIYLHAPAPKQIRALRKNPQLLYLSNLVGGPSATIHRRTVSQQYDLKMKWLVDIDFYIRVLSENQDFSFSAQPLVRTRVVPNSVTAASVGNRQIEVFEFSYLYGKLSRTSCLDIRFYARLWSVFVKYGVTSRQDLLDLGVVPTGMAALDRILFFQKVFQRLGLLSFLRITQTETRRVYRIWRNFRSSASAKRFELL